ncbi:MFS transporter [Lichenicoccus sp.]|uniref:MFS transporter n=1 Tax=Lichenicoccus sp. TaxID=2781899 RepID=UPI003D12760C
MKTIPINDADESAIAQRCLARVRLRVIPVVMLLYFVAYLDRNNVGFAAPELRHDVGLTAASFGFGAGIFFIGYFLFEVPSNAGMHRFGARRWMARILVSWGICAAALALVRSAWTFDLIRFLLGAAEAGFSPAILYFFTLWFPERERARALGFFVLTQPIANAIGAPVSGLLLSMDGILGLHGWQWLFILEGIPAVVLGLLAPFLLTDRPEAAAWLPDDERRWLAGRLRDEAGSRTAAADNGFMAGIKDRRFMVYAALNFGLICGVYGLSVWLPTIVRALSGMTALGTGFLVLVPYSVAAVATFVVSRRAARTGKIAQHASISIAVAAAALVGAGLTLPVSAVASMACLCVACAGIYASIAPLLAMPSGVLCGAGAAAGLAVTNSVGNLAGFLSPYAVGLLKGWTGGDRAGLFFLGACLVATSIGVFFYARHRPEGLLRTVPASPL